MPNTPARVTLGLSTTNDNVARFGADQGLLVPDQVTAQAAAEGPAAFYTIPNNVSAVAGKWWRPWVQNSGNAFTFTANQSVGTPLLVAKTCSLQAIAMATPNTNGWASNVIVSVYYWTGVGLQVSRLRTVYLAPQFGAAGVQYAYLSPSVILEKGLPHLVVASSTSSWYCCSRQALPPLFPGKTANPTDVGVSPSMVMPANAAQLPDAATMASIDLDAGVPLAWSRYNYSPHFFYRLDGAVG